VAFSPTVPMPIPATEAVMITRLGSLMVAVFVRRGVNLVLSDFILLIWEGVNEAYF
jgi:hypothetical protein